jgi:hypothetical protein
MVRGNQHPNSPVSNSDHCSLVNFGNSRDGGARLESSQAPALLPRSSCSAGASKDSAPPTLPAQWVIVKPLMRSPRRPDTMVAAITATNDE